MKRVNFFAMLAAAAALTMGVTSCSKDDNGDNGPEIGNGERAKLSVSVAAPVMSKATGTTVPTDAVGNFTVLITDKSTGDINSAWSTYSSTGVNLTGGNAIDVTTSAENIYIVANAGDLTSITSLNGATGLKSYLADLNGASAADGNQSLATNRWATGVTASALSFSQNGSDWEASTTVTLTFIAARITVTVDNQMTNYGGTGSLSLNDVAVMNARGQSLLFPATGTSLIPSAYNPVAKTFYEGLADDSFANYPAITDFTMAASLLSDALDLSSNPTYYYYVFENDATADTDFPTIVTLVGEDEDGEALYWPVHLAAYEQWANNASGNPFTTTGIQRGHSYNINIKLTGDATNGGGSTTDPTKPVVNATVEVSVDLTDWIAVPLEKEF